jgi:hypothetical protein
MTNSEWFFWRAVFLHCRKIFGASGDAPSSFSACFSRLRLNRHRLQSVDKQEGEAHAEPKRLRVANGAVPSKFSPNEFGAQEKFVTNHWLKTVALGKNLNTALSTSHLYTLALMHACTQ